MIDSVVEKSGTYKGLNYEIRAVNMGWRCGYVNLLERLKGYFSYGETVNSLDVHGGITFIEDDCIGFDCAHITDEYDESIMSDKYKEFNISHPRIPWKGATIKDVTFVEKECKKLIRQLLKIKTPYEKGFEAGKKTALQWQPIETLDLTQKQVLLFNKDWDMTPYKVGEIWHGQIMVIGGRFYYDYAPPTHWAPLPLPPAPEVKDVE